MFRCEQYQSLILSRLRQNIRRPRTTLFCAQGAPSIHLHSHGTHDRSIRSTHLGSAFPTRKRLSKRWRIITTALSPPQSKSSFHLASTIHLPSSLPSPTHSTQPTASPRTTMRFLTTIFLLVVSLAALASANNDKKGDGTRNFRDVVKDCVVACNYGPHCAHYCECKVYKLIGKNIKCNNDHCM